MNPNFIRNIVKFCPRAGKDICFIEIYKKNGKAPDNLVLTKTVCPEADLCNSKRCELNQF